MRASLKTINPPLPLSTIYLLICIEPFRQRYTLHNEWLSLDVGGNNFPDQKVGGGDHSINIFQ